MNQDVCRVGWFAEFNKLRARKYEEWQSPGYQLISYVSFACVEYRTSHDRGQLLCPRVCSHTALLKSRNDVFIWSGNHIGHHAEIDDHCYIAGNAMISGNVTIEPYCFIGVSATIGHE